MPRPWQRMPPWPYDARIGGVGVMLRTDQNGAVLVGRKTQRLDQVVPPSYAFVDSLPPYVERPFNFGPCPDGMGQKRQGAGDGAYRYAIRADLSIGGVARIGPQVTIVSPPTSGEILGFVDAPDGTNGVRVWAQAGRYMLNRAGDQGSDWNVSKDFGAAFVASQAVRWGDGVGSADALYVAAAAADKGAGGQLWQKLGANWTQATLPAGMTAHFIEATNRELWVGGGTTAPNELHKLTIGSDPMVAGSWSAAFFIGDIAPLTYLRAVDDVIYVFKQNGIYTLNTDGTSNELFPELRTRMPLAASAWNNGRLAFTWRNAVWFNFAGVPYQLTPGAVAVLDTVGLARLVENDSEVRGEMTAFAGDPFFGWYAHYNADNGHSYLVKHGTWLNPGASPGAAYVFSDVPNGAVVKIENRKITALHVSWLPGPNPRLYIGFASKEIGWIDLPRFTPDPAADPNCRFTTDESAVYYQDHDANAPSDPKHWRGFTAVGPALDGDNTVTAESQTENETDWTPLPSAFTRTGQRIATPGARTSKRLRVRSVLRGVPAATPQLTALVLHEQIRPALALEYELTVLATDSLARRDGMFERRSAAQIRAALEATSGANPTVVTFPDGTTQTVDFIDYAEALTAGQRSYGEAWDVTLKLVEFRNEQVVAYVDDGTLALMMPLAPAQSR